MGRSPQTLELVRLLNDFSNLQYQPRGLWPTVDIANFRKIFFNVGYTWKSFNNCIMCGTTSKYSLSGPSSILSKIMQHCGQCGQHGHSMLPAGSEAEFHAGGHGMVLNSRQHNAC